MNVFGENLRKIRNEKGMSQDELAVLLCTSKQVISRYENAQRSPKVSTVAEYAEKLDVSISDLTTEHEDGFLFFAPHDDAAQKLHDIGQQLTAPFRSDRFITLSEGLAKMEKENAQAFQALYTYLISAYPNDFTERTDDNANDSES